jgi:hypothetical protein
MHSNSVAGKNVQVPSANTSIFYLTFNFLAFFKHSHDASQTLHDD